MYGVWVVVKGLGLSGSVLVWFSFGFGFNQGTAEGGNEGTTSPPVSIWAGQPHHTHTLKISFSTRPDQARPDQTRPQAHGRVQLVPTGNPSPVQRPGQSRRTRLDWIDLSQRQRCCAETRSGHQRPRNPSGILSGLLSGLAGHLG